MSWRLTSFLSWLFSAPYYPSKSQEYWSVRKVCGWSSPRFSLANLKVGSWIKHTKSLAWQTTCHNRFVWIIIVNQWNFQCSGMNYKHYVSKFGRWACHSTNIWTRWYRGWIREVSSHKDCLFDKISDLKEANRLMRLDAAANLTKKCNNTWLTTSNVFQSKWKIIF